MFTCLIYSSYGITESNAGSLRSDTKPDVQTLAALPRPSGHPVSTLQSSTNKRRGQLSGAVCVCPRSGVDPVAVPCVESDRTVMAESWRDFAAGWAGGSLGILFGHPLDTIKVRQQALLVSPLHCLRSTLRHEGARGLFKGLAFPLVSAGAVNSVFFGVYSSCLRWLDGGRGGSGEPSLRHVAVAGGLGGVVQLSVAVPVELVKIQLQTRTGAAGGWVQHYQTPAAGPISCLAALYRSGGAAAWYRGLGVQLLRDVPASSAYFFLYEAGLRESRRRGVPSALAVLAAGGVAGVLSWALILPLDVVKSRIQADNPERPQFRGVLHCARETVVRDGPAALFRGFSTMAARAFVVNAVTLFGYEYFMIGLRLIA